MNPTSNTGNPTPATKNHADHTKRLPLPTSSRSIRRSQVFRTGNSHSGHFASTLRPTTSNPHPTHSRLGATGTNPAGAPSPPPLTPALGWLGMFSNFPHRTAITSPTSHHHTPPHHRA